VTTESYLWTKLKKMPQSEMTRHEDKLNFGIPDVSFGLDGINGWIELKAFKGRPPRGVFKFSNLQNTQVRFLERRGKAGGHCYIMVIVNRGKSAEFFLFHWSVVRKLFRTELSIEDLYELCCYYSYESIRFKSLRASIHKHP